MTRYVTNRIMARCRIKNEQCNNEQEMVRRKKK
jgi:hypothetical protein